MQLGVRLAAAYQAMNVYELNPYTIGSPLADLSESVVRSVDLLPLSGCQLVTVNQYVRRT